MVALDVLAGRATWALEQGDVLERLAALPDGSINCVITSPPYWGLRDYGVKGQIGLEPTPDAYVARMVAVFREIRRVLRADGTCWVNLGDSYATKPNNNAYHGKGPDTSGLPNKERQAAVRTPSKWDHIPEGLKPKDLVGIPWRVAFALQADGWWLRSDVVWAKPNPMPESVTDRPTRSHEYLFLLTKSARYVYDADAIREPHAEATSGQNPYGARGEHYKIGRDGTTNGVGSHPTAVDGHLGFGAGGRNKRSVWNIATEPYAAAHFATMPTKLVEPCVLAGCPEKCCPACGAPWERVVERTPMVVREGPGRAGLKAAANGSSSSRTAITGTMLEPATSTTVGWQPTCRCDRADTVPGVVLDPFVGSGTVVLEALRHGRRGIGFDLSPTYADLARRRVVGDCPLFNTEAAG